MNPTKKLVAIGMLVLTSQCFTAFGTITILEAWREVGVSGETGGNTYSESAGQAGGGAFSSEVSGEAFQSNPPVIGHGFGSGYSYARSSQESEIGEDGVSVEGSLYMQSWAPGLWALGALGTHDAAGRNLFSVTFQVLEPQAYELEFWQLLGQNEFWFTFPEFRRFDFFDFTSPLYGNIVQTDRGTSVGNWSGVLLPDVYTLSYLPDLFTATDYLGDSAQVVYRLDLSVSAVPEGGDTLWLLGIGIAGLVAARHFRVGDRIAKISCLLVAGIAILCGTSQAGWDPLERVPPQPIPPYRPIK